MSTASPTTRRRQRGRQHEKVPNFEKSWVIFARADLKGRMTMLDDMREVIGDALAFLGYSVNTVKSEELAAATKLINVQWKAELTKFDAEAFAKGFAAGDLGRPGLRGERLREIRKRRRPPRLLHP
jgi:hypothetical protein